jgi:ribonuclease HII
MTRKIDPELIPPQPHLQFETTLWSAGCQYLGGIDESGRGCLAGPVFAAVVILPRDRIKLHAFSGVMDSKKLTFQEREDQRCRIEDHCLDCSVGSADNIEIDRFGIMPATRLAVQRAIDKLILKPDHLLVDYIVLPNNPLPQTRLTKGDARSLTIAAASILAKTHRDKLMIAEAEKYPLYGFENNKGYGTSDHLQAIHKHGPSPIHRTSFAPLRNPSEQE